MMDERLKAGDYGEISFTIKSKRKYTIPGDPFIVTGFVMMGEIIEADNKNLLVRDNDDQEYIVNRQGVRSFKRAEKPIIQPVQ